MGGGQICKSTWFSTNSTKNKYGGGRTWCSWCCCVAEVGSGGEEEDEGEARVGGAEESLCGREIVLPKSFMAEPLTSDIPEI